jgi:hypothetical protein
MRIKLLWFYLFLTEGLVVYSNLSILLLSFFVLRSLKTVNSICLGTCSSCFFRPVRLIVLCSRSGCKSTTSFHLASVFWKFFENFRFRFLLIAPISATTYSTCHLLPSVGKDNYLFHFANLFF